MSERLLQGDALDRLRELPTESVHCVVTSPPYFGLRDYGVDGQIGLEETPEAYVARIVQVFAEVRRVLRKDGTLWLNMGDSYAARKCGRTDAEAMKCRRGGNDYDTDNSFQRKTPAGLKPKDLIGMPWMIAFALRAEGWYLRCDVVWSKPNPMPESVTDRPTKAHEYLFLLSKSERYFYDAEAIKEPMKQTTVARSRGGTWHNDSERPDIGYPGQPNRGKAEINRGIREKILKQDELEKQTYTGFNARYDENPPINVNKRSVWTVATAPYKDAHFATFPPDLVKPCVLAGTSEKGCCPCCGSGWKRVVEASGGTIGKGWHDHSTDSTEGMSQSIDVRANSKGYTRKELGWQPSCDCEGVTEDDLVPAVVLDPFAGSGTTLAVALSLGRRALGIELNPDYIVMAEARIAPFAAQGTLRF